MSQLPDKSPNQLKVYETVQRIKMAWIALWFALGLFGIVMLALLYLLILVPAQEPVKIVLGTIEAILGATVYKVYAHLFPPPPSG